MPIASPDKRSADRTFFIFSLAFLLLISASDGLAKAPSKKSAVKAVSAKEQALRKNPAFLKACSDYQHGKYKEAIGKLNYLDAHGGCCQWTHYYLGLCYQGLNQLGMSYRHYQWVLTYGRDANLRRYSQFAQDTLAYYAANRTYAGQAGIAGAVAQSQSGSADSGGGGFG